MDIKVPHANKSVISDRRETSFASQLLFQLATSHQQYLKCHYKVFNKLSSTGNFLSRLFTIVPRKEGHDFDLVCKYTDHSLLKENEWKKFYGKNWYCENINFLTWLYSCFSELARYSILHKTNNTFTEHISLYLVYYI